MPTDHRHLTFYRELLDDRSVARLPDHLWRRLFELFCFASRHQASDGTLPPLAHMAWTLRCSEEELEADLTALSRVQNPPVERREGGWTLTSFSRRSAAGPAAPQPEPRGRDDPEREEGRTEGVPGRGAGPDGRVEEDPLPGGGTTRDMLSAFGIAEPVLSSLAHLDPRYVKPWIEAIRRRPGLRNPAGLLVSFLSAGVPLPVVRDPDTPGSAGGPSAGISPD